MGKNNELTEEERGQIDLLRRLHTDWSHSAIANALNRSRSTITKYLADPQNYGRKKRSGRPKITSKRQDNVIKQTAISKRLSANAIKSELGLECSASTVTRRLSSDPKIIYTKFQSGPELTAVHKANRLSFAKKCITFDNEKWEQIIFSDEKKWNLDGPDGIRSYWHDLRKEKPIFSRRQGGGGSVMIWSGFSANGKLPIHFCKRKMNSLDYQDILADNLLPNGPLITNGDYIFQQDNAPIHASYSTKAWFEANEVKVLDWPAKSPDLNPIENLWLFSSEGLRLRPPIS